MPIRVTLILAFVVAAAGTSPPAVQEASPPSMVGGVALDAATGEPLADVDVRLSVYLRQGLPPPSSNPNDYVIVEVETGGDGRFVLEVAGIEGRQPFFLTKPGYLNTSGIAFFSPGQTSTDHVFRLAREGIVHGRVLDGAGRPAVDVEVTLYQYRPATFAHLAGRRPEYTDDRGEFRFFGLNPGQYVVGYAPREFAIREPPPFEFGGSGYRPTVRGEFAPLRSVPATLYPGARRLEDAGIIDLAIGEELELRDVTLAAPSLGRIELELDGGETPPQDLRISALGVEADGAGVLSTEPLTFWPRQVGMVHIMANWTRDDGETVSLSTPVLFDGGDTDVRIDLSPQGSLDIRTVRENADGTVEAVSGRVRLCPARFDPWLCVDSGLLFGGMARSDRIVLDDGLARVSSLPAGEYHLFGVDVPEGSYLASALQGERDVLVDGVDVSGNSAPLDLRFATGSASLAGRVTDANGEPVPQAFVVLIPEAPLRYSWVADHRAWTAVDGTFALEGIAPGRYRIAARPYPRGSVHVPDAEAIREIRERGTPVEFGVGDEGSVDLVLDGASLN